jgi:hypothetical protein
MTDSERISLVRPFAQDYTSDSHGHTDLSGSY